MSTASRLDRLHEAKKELRVRILTARDALTPGQRDALSAEIAARVLALPIYRAAHAVAGYASFGSELATVSFLKDVLRSEKMLLLPRVDRSARVLVFHQVGDLAELRPGPWGIPEPDPVRCPAASLERVDFMLVPGVAFTAKGARLGYGGGYYDRVLAGLASRTAKIAAAFSLQIVESLPMAPGDRMVDGVVTESEYLGTAKA